MRLHPATLTFLQTVQEHNSRNFFALVKPLYEEIYEQLQNICTESIQRTAQIDEYLLGLEKKDCLFRIYRDARRIKEGDLLYKTNRGIVLAHGGKKSGIPGYYLHIEAGNKSFFGGGVYMPPAPYLYNLRRYLAKHGATYNTLIHDPGFVRTFGAPVGETTKKPPRGFTEQTPFLDLVMKKQHLIYAPLSDDDILTIDIPSYIAQHVATSVQRMQLLVRGCLEQKNGT